MGKSWQFPAFADTNMDTEFKLMDFRCSFLSVGPGISQDNEI